MKKLPGLQAVQVVDKDPNWSLKFNKVAFDLLANFVQRGCIVQQFLREATQLIEGVGGHQRPQRRQPPGKLSQRRDQVTPMVGRSFPELARELIEEALEEAFLARVPPRVKV